MLAQFLRSYASGLQRSFMDDVIDKLKRKHLLVKTGPADVVATWKSLLFDESFSDIRFLCGDHVLVHAHKCVLAAASPVFAARFSRQWDNNASCETQHASPVIMALLTFVYTGSSDDDVFDQNACDLLRAADEYQLDLLRAVGQARCARQVTVDNVYGLLEFAAHNSFDDLKAA